MENELQLFGNGISQLLADFNYYFLTISLTISGNESKILMLTSLCKLTKNNNNKKHNTANNTTVSNLSVRWTNSGGPLSG